MNPEQLIKELEKKYTMNYILDENGEPVPEPDIIKWGQWFEKYNRHVASTWVGRIHISTVFLGMDHGFGRSSAPILYETMVFGGAADGYMNRYVSKEQAEEFHNQTVHYVKSLVWIEQRDQRNPMAKMLSFGLNLTFGAISVIGLILIWMLI